MLFFMFNLSEIVRFFINVYCICVKNKIKY